MNKFKHLYLLRLLSLFSYLPSFAQNTTCTNPDYAALVAFYNATGGDNWIEKWDLSNCDVCSWAGIGCDPLTGRVDLIFLANNNLIGQIPPEIGDLRYLLNLNLSSNQLSGTIPIEIENLAPVLGFITGLRFLSLDNNQLSGPIPDAIGNLSGGSILELSNNNFEGPIPDNLANFGDEVNLNMLQINVDNNQLSGCFPNNLNKFCPGDAFVSFSALGNTDLPNSGDFSLFCEMDKGACTSSELTGCDALQFISATEQITVTGLTTSSKVEIIGRNTLYQTIVICEDNCPEMLVIPDLDEGAYTVKVNLFDGENYCYKETSVMVDGDNNTGNENADCDNLVFTGEVKQITIEGLITTSKVEILGHNTDWQVIPICDGDCSPTLVIPDLESGEYTVKVNQLSNDGSYCYLEDKIVVGSDVNDTIADCDKLTFTVENDQIIIDGLTASYDKVEIIGRNTDWQVVPICDGDCADTQIISDLVAGEYAVKVNQGGSDNSYCYREEKVLVENNNNSRNSITDFSGNLVVYPNPARDRINIQLPNLAIQKGTIHIYNVFGQPILATSINELNQNVLTLDLNGFDNGIYTMTIQIDGTATFSRRFVVEHLR